MVIRQASGHGISSLAEFERMQTEVEKGGKSSTNKAGIPISSDVLLRLTIYSTFGEIKRLRNSIDRFINDKVASDFLCAAAVGTIAVIAIAAGTVPVAIGLIGLTAHNYQKLTHDLKEAKRAAEYIKAIHSLPGACLTRSSATLVKEKAWRAIDAANRLEYVLPGSNRAKIARERANESIKMAADLHKKDFSQFVVAQLAYFAKLHQAISQDANRSNEVSSTV